MPEPITFRHFAWLSFRFRIGNDEQIVEFFKNNEDLIKDYRMFEYEYVQKDNKNEEVKRKKIWPGLVFVKVALQNGKLPLETREFLRQIPNFVRFYSYTKNWNADPILFSQRHIEKIEKQINVKETSQTNKLDPKDLTFKVNDIVSVLVGVFRGYEGEVTAVDYETGIITLNVEFFGRVTPVKVAFNECKKKN